MAKLSKPCGVASCRNYTTDLLADVCSEAFRASCPLPLQFISKPRSFATQAVEVRAGKPMTVAGRCDIDDADVHTEPAADIVLLGWHFDRHKQVELAGTEREVGLTAVMNEQLALIVAADERNPPLTSAHGPDANSVVSSPSEDPRIVRDSAERTEHAFRADGILFAIGVSHLGDATYDHLRGEPEFSPTVVISELVDGKLSKRALRPRLSGEPIAGRVGATQRIGQRDRLLWRRLQLNLNS